MQTAVVWSSFPFIRSCQNHLARHSERGKKTRRTKEEVGRQHQGMDRPGVWQVPEGSVEQGKMEKTGCKIICGAPATLMVKGLMMIMMMLDGKRLCEWDRGQVALNIHSPFSCQRVCTTDMILCKEWPWRPVNLKRNVHLSKSYHCSTLECTQSRKPSRPWFGVLQCTSIEQVRKQSKWEAPSLPIWHWRGVGWVVGWGMD